MGWSRKKRMKQERCEHTQRISVTAAGVERLACEQCGHVSFSFQDGLEGPVRRHRVAPGKEGLSAASEPGLDKAGARN